MYKLVDISSDRKIGPIPAVWGSKETCPITCALYSACYAKMGHCNVHFNRASLGVSFSKVIDWVQKFPNYVDTWRFGISGELPGNHVDLDISAIVGLAKANKNRHGIVYTHYPVNNHNLQLGKTVKLLGLNINFSCDTIDDVKSVVNNGLNAVTYTTWDDARKSWKQDGIKFVTCPNQSLNSKPQCIECKLCAKPRDYVIVFRPHGASKKKISAVV